MIGLDCNILVQLAFADHPANAKTVTAVQKETQAGEKSRSTAVIHRRAGQTALAVPGQDEVAG